jgi:hypothetical protein
MLSFIHDSVKQAPLYSIRNLGDTLYESMKILTTAAYFLRL